MAWALEDLQRTFRHERVVVTPYTFSTIFLPAFLGFYTMAVLVQLQGTRLCRLSLLPVIFWTAFQASVSLDFSWGNPGYAYLNQGLALAMFTIAMRSTVWAFAKRPYTRLPICKPRSSATNGHIPPESKSSVSSAMWNAWDFLANMRGIGWSGPSKMPIPTPYFQVESRFMFLLLSLFRFVFLMLVFDALTGYVRSLGPDTFGTPKGGTIFDPSLTEPKRYMKSALVTLLSGTTGYIIIDTVYQLHAILFSLLFWQYPSQWPPLFDSPFLSTSLASLWGRRWHQLFREYFVAVGSKPLERYFGRAGGVMGAFAVSGVLHDVGMRGMDRGADTLPVVGFFLMQGVGIIMEHTWRRITGRRVGGILGLFWVYFWLLSWGQIIVDVWARRGLIASQFFPEAYRPFPFLLNWIFRQ